MILAFLWGLFEATFFFLIPDMVITLIAIHGFKEGLDASLLALAGALIGGSMMYFFAIDRSEKARQFVRRVPAVSDKMLDDVEESLVAKGLIAMIIGPIRGIPYKAFAIFAPKYGIRFFPFFLASIPARFIRFFVTFMIAWLLADILFNNIPMWTKYVVWAIIWIIVYIIYFSIHPWNGQPKKK